jgi:drug/metabolite transporter (DMT)-like permease
LLGRLFLANAMPLKLTATILIPMIALIWLRERFTASVRLVMVTDFVGALLMLRPAGKFEWASAAGLAAGRSQW